MSSEKMDLGADDGGFEGLGESLGFYCGGEGKLRGV